MTPKPEPMGPVERVPIVGHLTARQLACVRLAHRGLSDAAIARQLRISITTVRYHFRVAANLIPGDLPSRVRVIAWYRGGSLAVLGAEPIAPAWKGSDERTGGSGKPLEVNVDTLRRLAARVEGQKAEEESRLMQRAVDRLSADEVRGMVRRMAERVLDAPVAPPMPDGFTDRLLALAQRRGGETGGASSSGASSATPSDPSGV